MNQQAFEAGKAAYQQGDLMTAVAQLSQAKGQGEVAGSVDHLLGNCLMRLGRYVEAAEAYGSAMRDVAYGHAGALACNRGRALLAANRPQDAVASLTLATKDETYATPFKAYMALGNAYSRIGNVREAGVAYRNAAIDENNPNPSAALMELGGCFMKMGRAVDAVEAYRTALDFSTPLGNQCEIFAELGLAYVAANRMSEAIDAFGHAIEDGTYTLRPEAAAAYEAAQNAVAAIAGDGPSETDALLAAAGYGTGAYDPLDPMGQSGELMPSPEDTGFFSVSEEDLVAQDKKGSRKKHGCLGFFIFLLVVVILAAGAGAFAYYKGYGWPQQQAVAVDLLKSTTTGTDISSMVANGTSEEQKAQIKAVLPQSVSSVSIDGVDKDMASSTVLATATLSAGGTQQYKIEFVRDGIGWKVSAVSAVYASQNGASTTVSSTGATSTEGASGNSSN